MTFSIRPIEVSDKPLVGRLLREHWSGIQIVSRGKVHDASALPGFIALRADKLAGLITYRVDQEECEIVTLNSLQEDLGIGTALLDAVISLGRSHNLRRVWLITTNDNIRALRFYQRRGMQLVALHRNALQESRKLKPQIPVIGIEGIPLRDEIELEILLNQSA